MHVLVSSDWHLDLCQHSGIDPIAGLGPLFDRLDALIIGGDLANNPARNWPDPVDGGRPWR